jgi:uncharacterized membrane protein
MGTISTSSGTTTIGKGIWVFSRTTVVVRFHMAIPKVEPRVNDGLERSPWFGTSLLGVLTTTWVEVGVSDRVLSMEKGIRV